MKVKLKKILRYLKKNIETITKIIVKKIIEIGYFDGKKYRLINKKFAVYNLISTKEIFVNELDKEENFNRLDTVVRYLAIEEYYKKNNVGFKLYEKMQQKRIRESKVDYLNIFKQTIKSFEEKGYDIEYPLEMDLNLNLLDGSHRFSLILYHRVPKISFRILRNRALKVEYGIEWFKNNGFTQQEINIILNKAKEIKERFISEFIGIIWGAGIEYKNQIMSDIEKHGNIKKINLLKEIDFENAIEFENFVRGIYHIDDIEEWKITKKIKSMKNHPLKVCVISMDVLNPLYRKKIQTGKPISIVMEEVKKIIRSKYKGKIKNYFYDILLHTADNEEQSIYMKKIIEKDIKICDFINSIKKENYVIIKEETPYSLKKFPIEYPFHKDLDILCSKDSYLDIVKKCLEFSEVYKEKYNIKILKNDINFKLRFELNGFLCYQIDISNEYSNLDLDTLLANKVSKSNYFIPRIEDEIIIREIEYKNSNNSKVHHLDFIKKYTMK